MFKANMGWHENSRIVSDKFLELFPLAGGFPVSGFQIQPCAASSELCKEPGPIASPSNGKANAQ